MFLPAPRSACPSNTAHAAQLSSTVRCPFSPALSLEGHHNMYTWMAGPISPNFKYLRGSSRTAQVRTAGTYPGNREGTSPAPNSAVLQTSPHHRRLSAQPGHGPGSQHAACVSCTRGVLCCGWEAVLHFLHLLHIYFTFI